MNEEAKLEKMWRNKFKEYFKDQEKRFIEKLEKAKKGVAESMGIDRSEELQSVGSLQPGIQPACGCQGQGRRSHCRHQGRQHQGSALNPDAVMECR